MKRLCFVIALLITFLNVYSQELLINEPQDSTNIQNETNKMIINPNDELIFEPNENVWTYGISKAYYTGGNVGIGTSSPLYKLHTQGDIYATGIMRTDGTFQVGPNGNRFIVNTSGKVGIGVTNPLAPLHIDGTEGILMQRSAWTPVKVRILLSMYTGPIGGLRFILTPDGNWANYKDVLFLSPLGRVGIGTTDPQSELSVKGKILAKEVEVTLEGWSDFVFERDYNLMSIKELEDYISQNKHLPDVPSGEEVKENGVNLGNMDKVLLQKIEELTLYIIQLENRVTELENK